MAQQTHLGYIISGPINGTSQSEKHSCSIVSDTDEYIKKFWETEEGVIEHSGMSQEEEECEKFYRETTYVDNDDVNDDPDSLNALTPQHFLTQDLLAGDIDRRDFLTTPEKYLSRWERMKKMRQEVCSRYRDEYITRLNNRPKQFTPKGNLVVGQLVLLREEHSPSSEWPLGRIAKTHPGDDGLVSVVTIVTQSG